VVGQDARDERGEAAAVSQVGGADEVVILEDEWGGAPDATPAGGERVLTRSSPPVEVWGDMVAEREGTAGNRVSGRQE
jgi:hypothetical protein